MTKKKTPHVRKHVVQQNTFKKVVSISLEKKIKQNGYRELFLMRNRGYINTTLKQ